jgi:hypothetical protein
MKHDFVGNLRFGFASTSLSHIQLHLIVTLTDAVAVI